MSSPTPPRWLPLAYAAAIFTSAFLLFQVQPLVSKHILPWFGGSAAVWTTCLLFFQTLLFFGYSYAHLIHSRLSIRGQVATHLGLILAAIIFARVLPAEAWKPTGGEEPVRAILLILALSIGLPYFVLSGTGPLLQAWFAASFPGRSPYRLYALSNVGSLLALLSYPFFFERQFNVPEQARFWFVGFVIYGLLCALAAWSLWKSEAPVDKNIDKNTLSATPHKPQKLKTQSGQQVAEVAQAPPAPRWFQYILWLVWPMFATIVLMATTNHISTDIAVMPFMWVVPLALYLLTFIIAFDKPQWYARTPLVVLVLISVYLTSAIHSLGIGPADLNDAGTPGLVVSTIAMLVNPIMATPQLNISTLAFLIANFATVFFICMLCHGELYRQRPNPKYLTSFYLMISLGGALGGMFVTFVAPELFSTFYEWQLCLFTACIIAIGYLLKTLVNFIFRDDDESSRKPWHYAFLGGLVLTVFLPSAVMLLDLVEFLRPEGADAVYRVRDFYGTLGVFERDSDDPSKHHFLVKHGVITHGAQFTGDELRGEPTTYYARTSGVAHTIAFYRDELGSQRMRVGVVGLGSGTMAAYARGIDAITFYEINPDVLKMTDSGQWFTYLDDARQRGADVDTRIGDARLTLERELERGLPQKYNVIVLDAFSGDSVPAHLLTVEAFKLYVEHLSQATDPGGDGAILIHISNRYLSLAPIAFGLAEHFKMYAVHTRNDDNDKLKTYRSDWVILTKNKRLYEALQKVSVEPLDKRKLLWTDTHSSLLDILK